jgi:hypothetical protein
MLLLAKLVGMALCQTGDDRDRSQLWLGREPARDQPYMRVEL